MVTIAPYAYFVERIVGNTLDVQTLIPPDMNLHIYEPSPKSVEMHTRANVWFQIGEPFEKKITQSLLEKNPKLKTVNLQAGLDVLTEEDAIELSPCVGHHHTGADLHTWLSPKLALKQAQHISQTLIALFPEYREEYQKNFNNLALDLQTLDRDIEKILSPFKGNALLVSHSAFGYFCRDYGLIQLSVECEGKEPRPRDIQQILEKTKIYPVQCVLLQKGFNNRGATQIGEKLQLPIYLVDPYARDYLKNMRQIAGNIAK
ncbi:MAG: Metal ABC transporter substrate-binding lipoprotein [Chlamydiae bacterium]|nr:Metal ABC transporter substrate-binding lipoprotein [Chlamydiota bacterium]